MAPAMDVTKTGDPPRKRPSKSRRTPSPTPSSPPPEPEPESDKRTRGELWFAAAKPPMYTVAVTPITVGSLAAAADTGAFSATRLFCFVLAAVGIIAWTNLTNDVFDFDTGIDAHKAESVVNLLGATRAARNRVLALANAVLLASFAAVVAISTTLTDTGARVVDPVVPAIIAVSVALGYAYQGPPFRLGYLGLGEPICFVAWALGVAAAYYAQLCARPAAAAALRADMPTALSRLHALATRWPLEPGRSLGAAALLVALPTTLILLCSHFHQIDDDRRAGKRSPVVRLGTLGASRAVAALVATFVALHPALLVAGRLPLPVFCAALPALPLALRVAGFVRRFHDRKELVRPAKYHAVKLHFVHGTLVALGYAFVAGRRLRFA